MSARPRILVSAALVALIAALVAGAAAGGARPWPGATATFLVQPQGGERPRLDLSFLLPSTSPPPARITVYVPPGFSLYPDRPAGAPVGDAELYASDSSAGTTGVTVLQGQIVARPLDAASDAALQACSPRSHLARWELSFNLLGQQLAMPIAISAAGDRPGLRLDICPPAVAPAGTLLPITNLALSLPHVLPPRARGPYLWRLEVTPAAPDRITPLPGESFELRSLVPVPQTLTLRGRYSAATRRVTLRGALREMGKPVRGVRVRIVKLVRTVTPGGILYDDVLLGVARTDATGAYALSARLSRTAGFIASTEPRVGRCADRGATPGGCRSQTIAAAEGEPITIGVPRRKP